MSLLLLVLGTAQLGARLANLGQVRTLAGLRLIQARLKSHLVLLQLVKTGLRAECLGTDLRRPLAEHNPLLPIDLLQVMVLRLVGERAT